MIEFNRMLSIRKVLEDNGIEIFTRDTAYIHISEININNNSGEWYVSDYGIVDDETIEQACRQYVRENGFKRSWLDKIEDDSYGGYFDYEDSVFDFSGKSNYAKLICWLYANDIEIKEDKNEM